MLPDSAKLERNWSEGSRPPFDHHEYFCGVWYEADRMGSRKNTSFIREFDLGGVAMKQVLSTPINDLWISTYGMETEVVIFTQDRLY